MRALAALVLAGVLVVVARPPGYYPPTAPAARRGFLALPYVGINSFRMRMAAPTSSL